MKPIALTGGIGSGKSTAASIFKSLGADIIDTDEIAHELTKGPALDAIRSAFGDEVFLADGTLDRKKMRELVFSDEATRKKLEAILHPLIRKEVERRLLSCFGPYCLVVIPLFFETGSYRDLAGRVLVVDCSEKLQISRAMERSNLSEEEVRRIMASQVSRKTRLEGADDLLLNENGIEDLRQKIALLHRKYLKENLKNPC